MSKLVLLKKENNESKDISLKNSNEDLKDRYFDFEYKIFNSEFHSKVKENELSICLKKIFYLNKNIFIKFLNSIYSDFLRTNSIVKLIEVEDNKNTLLKSTNVLLKAIVKDEYMSYEYNIEIQCSDVENISILILKNQIDKNKTNIINFRKKKEEYKSIINNKQELENPDLCLIMLNSNINVPDNYKVKNNLNNYKNNLKIIKAWKYDIKDIVKNELFMLLPLKILDLKNMINSIQNMNNSNKVIEDEIERFYVAINRHLEILEEDNVINKNDIDEFNLVSKQLLKFIY